MQLLKQSSATKGILTNAYNVLPTYYISRRDPSDYETFFPFEKRIARSGDHTCCCKALTSIISVSIATSGAGGLPALLLADRLAVVLIHVVSNRVFAHIVNAAGILLVVWSVECGAWID
jgi:hypothetical protein